MAQRSTLIILTFFALVCTGNSYAEDSKPLKANGISIPKGYKNWKLIAVSHRNDKQSLRAILGNQRAHKATKKDSLKTWPEGSILAKLVWNDRTHKQWSSAVVPGSLSHVEFMVKDSRKYPDTGGWGFARWIGMELKPYDDDGSECFACHTKVKENDFVFTQAAQLP